MTKIELVVARYQEDLAWLKRVPGGVRVTVYDKGGQAEGRGIPLPNVGREAHTYLHHIVTRYTELADLTIFCQGRPFDHVPDLHKRLRNFASGADTVADFRWLGFVIDHDDVTGARLFQTWSKNPEHRPLDLADFWRALWSDPLPQRFTFFLGAHFAVTSARVQRQPREWYQRACDVSMQHPDAAHCFERCWDRVFGCDGIPPEFRARDEAIYLRPIRALGITWDDVPPAYHPPPR